MAQSLEAKKKKVLSALGEMRIVTHACKKAGVSTSSFYRWVHEDETFEVKCEEAIKEGTNKICDVAEAVLIGKIQKGDASIAKYWLEKHRDDYKPRLREPSRTELKAEWPVSDNFLEMTKAADRELDKYNLEVVTRDKSTGLTVD
jgi:hypothetical protein